MSESQGHFAFGQQYAVELTSKFGFVGLGEIDGFARDRIVQFLFQWRAVVEKNPVEIPASPVGFIAVGKVSNSPTPCEFSSSLWIEGIVGFDGTETVNEESTVNQDGCWHDKFL